VAIHNCLIIQAFLAVFSTVITTLIQQLWNLGFICRCHPRIQFFWTHISIVFTALLVSFQMAISLVVSVPLSHRWLDWMYYKVSFTFTAMLVKNYAVK